MNPKCDLCRAEPLTRWHYEDDQVWVADCVTCQVPMIVWKGHGVGLGTDDASVQMRLEMRDVVLRLFPRRSIDWQRRQIPDHLHAHIV